MSSKERMEKFTITSEYIAGAFDPMFIERPDPTLDLKYLEKNESNPKFYAKIIIGEDDTERIVMLNDSREPTTL